MIQIHKGVNRRSFREENFLFGSIETIVDLDPGPRCLADFSVDPHPVIEPGGGLVSAIQLDHREADTHFFHFTIRKPQIIQQLNPGAFKPWHVTTVINDSHHIRLRIPDTDCCFRTDHRLQVWKIFRLDYVSKKSINKGHTANQK